MLFSFQLTQLYYSPSSPVLAMPVTKGFALASPQIWNPEIMLYTKAIKIISFGGQYFLILSSVSILFSFHLGFTCFLFITRVFLCPSSALSLPSLSCKYGLYSNTIPTFKVKIPRASHIFG